MSTINSKTARELLEAYHAVYQTEETITEEQLWEEVENWVNSLIEEGYDLSEYTWEEMYDAYIEEQGRASGAERRSQQAQVRANRPPVIRPGAGVGRGQGGRPLGDTTYRSGGRLKRDAAPKTAPAPTPTPKPSRTPTPTPAPAPSRTPAPAPAPSRPTAAAKTAPAPAKKKTPNPLMQKTFGYQTGGAPGQSGFKKATTTPNVSGMKSGRLATAISGPNKKIGEGYDAYDVVLNYIVENGHAESLDEAHYIMMEMSPEMIQDIVTECEVVNFLCVEGYVDTLEEAEWMMENIIDEEAIDIILGEELTGERLKRAETKMKSLGRRKSTADNRSALFKVAYGKEGTGLPGKDGQSGGRKGPVKRGGGGTKGRGKVSGSGGDDMDRGYGNRAERRSAKEEFEAWLDEAMTNYEKNRKRAAQRAAARNEARRQGKTGAVPGVGYVTPRMERETWTDESGQERHTSGARMPKKDKK